MRGLIVDYCGVLDGPEADRTSWYKLLRQLKDRKIPVAVLSNDPGGPAAEPIRELEYKGIVDAVLLSGEIGFAKPSKEAFQITADTLAVDMKDCVLVDDSILNVQAAVQTGLVGVFYQSFERCSIELANFFNLTPEH